jgi:UDP-N-acetylglucosamine transferase subunit ALG13
MTGSGSLRLFVALGTDHHPFDRLVSWVDGWVVEARSRSLRVDCLVQHGASRPPAHALGTRFLPVEEMHRWYAEADVVVCHGGPATIAEARGAGHRPLVVPRRSELGEHVDDHQVAFARRVAKNDQIVLAETYVDLSRWLDLSLERPDHFATFAADDSLCVTLERFRRAVSPLLGARS